MVASGTAKLEDMVGNDQADPAADWGAAANEAKFALLGFVSKTAYQVQTADAWNI